MTVLIGGGGIAGAAAACMLGPEATLFERMANPHDKVCGEFISWEAQDMLDGLGLDLAALGGHPIHTVRLVHGARMATTRLPGQGLGLSRRRLDEALLALAAKRGARVVRGHAVRRVRLDGVRVGGLDVDGLGVVPGARVLLATGKHGMHGMPRPAADLGLVGFKTYYTLTPEQTAALAHHVEVVLFPGGYAGLQLVEAGRANLCLLIQARALVEAGGGWPGVLGHLGRHAPHLARRLRGATPLLERPVSIARVPYGFVHAGPAVPGLSPVGDQMAVIPSFSGDGMAIALHTALAAARPDAARDAVLRAGLRAQVGRAMVLHRLGQSHPAWVLAAARLWPGGMAWVARLTRVVAAPGLAPEA